MIKIKPAKPYEKEYLKAQCLNGHRWGDGKTVMLNSRCPICKGEVAATIERRIYTVDSKDFSGIIGSKGRLS